ncbi:MAG: D-glycero-beta-D-manno-heptose 1-phosphate adenylyltransferase [Bacteroidales bacterium]|jgi:rfaE bifunctional protein nucleotidyltransferase chain/domain|nr:D-glycero-beta-D-manno-heptose 1-phosphate adenylyltransferase [Bacteroidales bacterium]HHT52753.1 D-glycero-beta-D-manno-heptose 1-phosphate adenylyltransferase [Bacteroidales bacterium]
MKKPFNIDSKIVTIEDLLQIKEERKNEQMVFSNGCFDILHVGHVRYLNEARSFGDYLVIGLNSDRSVRQLKGPDRPINQQDSRAVMLAALAFVDYVVIFDEETPLVLIQQLLPDILVKGSDYDPKDIVGGKEVIANGGKVVTVPLVEGFSSTKIINKLKDQA